MLWLWFYEAQFQAGGECALNVGVLFSHFPF